MKNIWRSIAAPPYRALPWLVFFYVVASALMMRDGGVFTGHLFGFDDHTHMVQALNWINGAGWYDRTILRANAPEGFTTIWPRIVDIPIAAIVLAAQQFVPQKTAALVAAAILPLAYSALLLFFAGPYFARPLVGKQKARLIVLFLLFTSLFSYKIFSPSGFFIGMVSHRPWYAILNLVMFGATARLVMGSARPSARFMLAASIALLGAVGIEGFPMIAGAAAILALASWGWNRPRLAARAADALWLAAAASLFLLALHHPPQQFFMVSFSEPSILGAILIAAAALFLTLEHLTLRIIRPKIISAIILSAAAVFLGAFLVRAFPGILNGGAAGLSPAERQLAYATHGEARPVWHYAQGMLDLVCLLMPLLLALGAGILCFFRSRGRRRALAFAYLGFAFIGSFMSFAYSRYYHHAMTAGSAWLLWAWEKIKKALRKDPHQNLLALLAFVALEPLWSLLIPDAAVYNRLFLQTLLFPALMQSSVDHCDTLPLAGYINAHYGKDANLQVPIDDSSKFLYYTDIHIDFLAQYPSHDKFKDNMKFFYTLKPAEAAEIAAGHGITLVALCTYPPMDSPIGGQNHSFYALLQTGQVPFWLKRVDASGIGNYMLYEVDKKALEAATHAKN